MKKWKKMSLVMAAVFALTGSALAAPQQNARNMNNEMKLEFGQYRYDNRSGNRQYQGQEAYRSNRVIKNVEIIQRGTYNQMSGIKVVDKTEAGVGQLVMNDLSKIVENKSYNADQVHEKMSKALDRVAEGKYAVGMYPQENEYKDFTLFAIYDAEWVEEQERAFTQDLDRYLGRDRSLQRYENRRSPRVRRPEMERPERPIRYENQRSWDSLLVILDRMDEIFGDWDRYGDWPWDRGNRRFPNPYEREKQVEKIDHIDVSSYRFTDETKVLTKDDMRRMTDYTKPYIGKDLRLKDIACAQDAAQEYLDMAYGDDVFEVVFDDLKPYRGQLNLVITPDEEFRDATGKTYIGGLRFGLVDDRYILNYDDMDAIEDILEKHERRFGVRGNVERITADVRNEVEKYLSKRYNKNMFKVEVVHRVGNIYQVIVR